MKSESSLPSVRWMLVDDDDSLRGTIGKLLAALAGVEVASFSSGAAALRAYAAAPDTFEFIVSDLDMPAMSGIEFCRRLRLINPRVKILLATGSGIINESEARGFGFCGMINKPFSVSVLRAALSEAKVFSDHQTSQASNASVCVAA